jgi:hypothetical protein
MNEFEGFHGNHVGEIWPDREGELYLTCRQHEWTYCFEFSTVTLQRLSDVWAEHAQEDGADEAMFDLTQRLEAALRMLIDSGDITPQGARIVTRILEDR